MLFSDIFNIKNEQDFYDKALSVFFFQYHNIPIYQEYCNLLKKNPNNVSSIYDIPFLPIQFFRNHLISYKEQYDIIFESSGTTQQNTSRHYVYSSQYYIEAFTHSFLYFFPDFRDFVWLALLPSYLERQNSSLVFMVNYFIKNSYHNESGFFLYNHDELFDTIIRAMQHQKKIILLGVSFSLLDFSEKYQLPRYPDIIVMETGGMKGRRPEITRSELHQILKTTFNVDNIYSEYGMTELLSQAYSKENGIFNCPPWMKILIRNIYDPFDIGLIEKNGGVNIIDLANYYSCSFIATDDLGIFHKGQNFEILGRLDNTINRGCNMLI